MDDPHARLLSMHQSAFYRSYAVGPDEYMVVAEIIIQTAEELGDHFMMSNAIWAIVGTVYAGVRGDVARGIAVTKEAIGILSEFGATTQQTFGTLGWHCIRLRAEILTLPASGRTNRSSWGKTSTMLKIRSSPMPCGRCSPVSLATWKKPVITWRNRFADSQYFLATLCGADPIVGVVHGWGLECCYPNR